MFLISGVKNRENNIHRTHFVTSFPFLATKKKISYVYEDVFAMIFPFNGNLQQ